MIYYLLSQTPDWTLPVKWANISIYSYLRIPYRGSITLVSSLLFGLFIYRQKVCDVGGNLGFWSVFLAGKFKERKLCFVVTVCTENYFCCCFVFVCLYLFVFFFLLDWLEYLMAMTFFDAISLLKVAVDSLKSWRNRNTILYNIQ